MKQPGIQSSAKVMSAVFIFVAGGLVACSSEQPKPQSSAQQQQATQQAQPNQPGQQPGIASPDEQAAAGQPQLREKLGIVSETPSSAGIPTQRTVIARQQIPTITVTRVGADINRMSASDFKALGLTGDLAQSIIQYRDAHGPFKSVKDLRNVPNMDQNWLADNQEQLAVTPSSASG